VQVVWEVLDSSSEARRIEAELASEERAAASAATSGRDVEASISGLEAQTKELAAALQRADARLQAVRREVGRLEREREGHLKEAADASAAVDEGRLRLASLAADVRRHQENATLARQARRSATQRVQEATALLNPLRHPRVKELFGSKG
jgi:chromosome segregation ATPase